MSLPALTLIGLIGAVFAFAAWALARSAVLVARAQVPEVVVGKRVGDEWRVAMLTGDGGMLALSSGNARQLARRLTDVADLVEHGPRL